MTASEMPAGPIPALEDRSLIAAMARWRDRQPEKTALVFPAQGVSFTYRELWLDVGRTAAGLLALGLTPGDRVAAMMPNSPEYVVVWLACDYAGLICVNVDPGLVGRSLTHVLRLTGPKLIVCDDATTASVDAVADELPSLEWLCNARGERRPAAPSLRSLAPKVLEGDAGEPATIDLTTTRSIRFTSGTTGPAKAVGFTESQMAVIATQYAWLGQHGHDDRLYSPFPLHHALSSINGVGAMLRLGASCVLDDRFHARDFWERIRSAEATATQMLRALMNILLAQPARSSDRDHQCRRAQWCPADDRFAERFGVHLVDVYGMSEGGFICYAPPGERPPEGAVGRPSPLYDVRIVDALDRDMPTGEPGELVWRPRKPHIMMAGYFGNPEVTVRAWRNLWYHTGDAAWVGADGYVRILGRMGDQIRRKGSNIPAAPIEEAACEYPRVKLAAAIAVPASLGESEIKLCVAHDGAALAVDAFVAFLRERLPRESVPRYVEFRSSLPLGSGNKVRKVALREEGDHGITPGTIDVERLVSPGRVS